MRCARFILIAVLWLGATWAASAASGRLVKALPHFLDLKGRHTLSPSLYERDAYQAYLRQNPKERSGLRFDVQWKSYAAGDFTVHLELRGRKGEEATTALLETSNRKRGLFSNWSSVELTGEAYTKFGDVSAWRATLKDGDTVVSEIKSFLW